MRFLHTSDLHIGKRVNEFSMMEDQKYILKQILNIAEEKQVDAVIIAGDVYDKAVPSAEAVQVFDKFLTDLAEGGKKVFVVSGNHDSPERIAFGAQLMSQRGVYMSPVYQEGAAKLSLKDEYGDIYIYLLPFLKPATVRHALELESDGDAEESEKEQISSYQDAVAFAVERMAADPKERNILVAHQFVTGAGRCESEEVTVGGLDNVDADIFEDFDYVALGHIHSPQWIKRETVRYCGTPLKYSFSEAEQEKSVMIAELKEKGKIELEKVLLVPLHDMRRIRGTYMEVTEKSFYEGTNTEDYLEITLTDEEDILDGMQKLRIIYPNLMRLLYDNSRTRLNHIVEGTTEVEKKSELELFEEFYELQNNQPVSREQEEFLKNLIEDIREA